MTTPVIKGLLAVVVASVLAAIIGAGIERAQRAKRARDIEAIKCAALGGRLIPLERGASTCVKLKAFAE